MVPLVPYVNILVCFCHAEMFNTKHNLECIQVKTVTINLHKRRNEAIESLLRLLAKSISKHIIFGSIKRTGARQCHPRDIDRMPVAIYCMQSIIVHKLWPGPSLKFGMVCLFLFCFSVSQIGTLETLIGSHTLYSNHVLLLLPSLFLLELLMANLCFWLARSVCSTSRNSKKISLQTGNSLNYKKKMTWQTLETLQRRFLK